MIRRAALACALACVLILALLAVRHGLGLETHWIDYDAPGIDITSEGPEG